MTPAMTEESLGSPELLTRLSDLSRPGYKERGYQIYEARLTSSAVSSSSFGGKELGTRQQHPLTKAAISAKASGS